MSKALSIAIWLIRQALNVTAEEWKLVLEHVQSAESQLQSKSGRERRAWVLDEIGKLFTSKRVLNLLIELAVTIAT